MIVDCAVYENGRRQDGALPVHEAMEACRRPGAFTWIGLYEPTADEFDSIRREFELHELAVEDAIHAHQRPKLEVYGEMVFIVLKTARYVDPEEIVRLGEILIFLGHDYIITVRHGEASELKEVRQGLEHQPELLAHGPGAVLHAIVDRVVDDYSPALVGLGEDIDEIENQVFSGERANPAERIYKLKREVLEFEHAVGPLVDPVHRLAKGQYEVIHAEVRTYFRDVNDHLLRADEQLENYRDLLTSVLSANLAQVTVRQNEDVRRISAIVAILAVPTMIAGIYGMNFEHMPELGWRFGYPLVLAVMAAICFALYRYFKRVGWL
ncbi:MAG TPA: magnesium/cobalt transporter CorA [Thermoleophilaceae bacterium]|nr:magnesium/cobalt transporter CorA [Thermoleophilaceae bacterium]